MRYLILLLLLAGQATAAGYWHPALGRFHTDLGRRQREDAAARFGPGQIVRREDVPLVVQDDEGTDAGTVTWGTNAMGVPSLVFTPDPTWEAAQATAQRLARNRRLNAIIQAHEDFLLSQRLIAHVDGNAPPTGWDQAKWDAYRSRLVSRRNEARAAFESLGPDQE